MSALQERLERYIEALRTYQARPTPQTLNQLQIAAILAADASCAAHGLQLP